MMHELVTVLDVIMHSYVHMLLHNLVRLTVASRRSSEELIFQGKVTVNGSVCNTPQVGFRAIY